jgi:hypothetical protein
MASQDSDRFVRWQEVTIKHLGALTNLVLGLATGLIAFESALLLEERLTAPGTSGVGLHAVLLLCASVGVGLWCTWNRLCDFRETSQIARAAETGGTDLKEKREEGQGRGRRTWLLLKVQLSLFGLGAIAGAVAVFLQVLE